MEVYKIHIWSKGYDSKMVSTKSRALTEKGELVDFKHHEVHYPISEEEWEMATDILDRAYGEGTWSIV